MARLLETEVKLTVTQEPLRWRHVSEEIPKNGQVVLGCIENASGATVANVIFIGDEDHFTFLFLGKMVECNYWASPILLPEALQPDPPLKPEEGDNGGN